MIRRFFSVAAAASLVALGLTPATPTSADALQGRWGELLTWPIIPIHMALSPQGDIMSFGTDQAGIQGGGLVYDLWDPVTGVHSVKPNRTPTDIFCAAQVIEPNSDQLLTAGGDISGPGNAGVPGVTLYSDATGSLSGAPAMNRPRWYPTANVLPNGDIVVQGGSVDGVGGPGVQTPEIRRADGTWDLLTGASSAAIWGNESQKRWWYPRSWVAPDGRLFGIAGSQMYYLDPAGSGSVELAGTFPGGNIMATSTAVMFRPGRILQVGGGAPANGVGGTASASATVVDLNGGAPTVTSVAPMSRARHWATSTVLADGTVLVTGGAAGNDTLEGVAYNPELWDPETGRWTTLAPERTHRLYHSAAILLPDGRVLSGGGGAPGPTNNFNAQIFSPPYLFEADGSPAARPVITSSPATVAYGSTFTVGVSSSATEFALVRAGSVTHSFNNGQRYIPVQASGTGSSRTLTAPPSGNVAPPGSYLLFALDADGTPSVASMLEIDPAADGGGGSGTEFGFEEGTDAAPGGWVNFAAGTRFGPWTVSSPVSKDHAAHHGGNGSTGHHLDLDGDGAISANVTGLTPGATYQLSFQTARHFLIDGPVSARVTIDGVTRTWSPTTPSTTTWDTVTVTFTATSATAPITFTGTGSPVPWGGALIDNAVIAAGPGPGPGPGPGAISGAVTNGDGSPEAGVAVDLFAAAGDGSRAAYLRSVTTGADGGFTFGGLDPGCYVLTFIAPGDRVFTNGSKWLQDGNCVEPGQTVTGADSVLAGGGASGASIGGAVTSVGGAPAAGVVVDLFTALADGSRGAWVRDTRTRTDGSYRFDAEGGCKVLTFIAPDGRSFTNGSRWANQTVCPQAGQTIGNINATLAAAPVQ